MESTRSDREEFVLILGRMSVPHEIRDDARIRTDAEKDRETVRAWGEEHREIERQLEHRSLAWLADLHNAPPEVAMRARTAVQLHGGELLFLFGEEGEYLGYGAHEGSDFYPGPLERV